MLLKRWESPPKTIWEKLAVFLPAAAWYAVIFAFSAQTGAESSELSNAVVDLSIDWMGDWGAIFHWNWEAVQFLSFLVRKGTHMGVFFVLTGLLVYGFWRLAFSAKAQGGLAISLCAVLAGLDEFHQLFVPGREGKLPDVLVDLGGGVIFLLVWRLVRGIIRRRAAKKSA